MTTFVTCFLNISSDDKSSIDWRIDKFMEIANIGINLHVYVDSIILEKICEKICNHPNVKITKISSIHDLFSFRVCSNIDELKIPETDNITKDTKEFMMIMNSKIEFVNNAIQENVFKTDFFAWIDFSISKNFSTKDYFSVLNEINNIKYCGKFLVISGCKSALSNKSNFNDINEAIPNELKSIFWRFCGGFFLGDKDSLLDFYEKYTEFFPKFVSKYKTIVWEVNFWAWLECNSNWSPTWYKGDHNDTIIEIPSKFLAKSINSKTNILIYDYPFVGLTSF